ncbi:MAG: MATE family efflux transporter, partial [Candidatus Izimaplasma sp.]|nr:MATE family efflux transporter [Candidatus Izimaplasma bacterium]
VSQAAGKNDMEEVTRAGNNGLIIMLALTVLYTLTGFFGATIFINMFNIGNTNIETYAFEYLRIISLFGFAYFLVNIFNGVYDGLGKTINTFLITSTGLVLNIVLDPLFILEDFRIFGLQVTGFGMGVRGAAIATAIAQSFILATYLVIYMTKYKPFKISLKKYYDSSTLKKIIKIGFPVGAQSVFFTAISIAIGIMIAHYGKHVMAVQRVGSHIEALAWMIALGFQVALASFVGQNYGAKRFDRIKEGYYTALKVLIPYGILLNIILFVFAEQLFGIFVSDPETLAIGKMYLEILSFSQLFMIVELGTAGAFMGLGKTMIPSSVGIIGNSLRVPFAYLLALSIGFIGIWWVVSISSILKGVVLTIWFLMYLRKMKKAKIILVEK